MTDELLGLPLEQALRLLSAAGIEPEVRMTSSPRGREDGEPRIVRVQNEGRQLVCARFLDPLAATATEE